MDTFARFESLMVNTGGITEMQENVQVLGFSELFPLSAFFRS